MGKAPSPPQPPPPTEEELRQQQEAEQAAIDARKRAEVEKAQMEGEQKREQWAISAGLRGRRSLLSRAGEVGYSTGLGGM